MLTTQKFYSIDDGKEKIMDIFNANDCFCKNKQNTLDFLFKNLDQT